MFEQLAAIADERIRVNSKPVSPAYRLRNGDQLSHRTTRAEPPVYRGEATVVFEDEDFVVVDKPPSIPVHECGAYHHNSLIRHLRRVRGGPDLLPPHRLDRLTSGVLLLAKTSQAAVRVGKSIESGEAEKVYLARVAGDMQDTTLEANMKCLSKDTFKWGVCGPEDPEGKPSRTAFARVSYCAADDTTLVRCRLYTGRTHQIRVHLAHLGHPVLNDVDYGGRWVGNLYAKYVLFYHWREGEGELLAKRPEAGGEARGPRGDREGEDALRANVREIFLHSKSYSIGADRFESAEPYWASPALAFHALPREGPESAPPGGSLETHQT